MNEEDIYTILARYFAGKSNEDERALLRHWLSESPDHRELFARAEQLWKTATSESQSGPTYAADDWQHFRGYLQLELSELTRLRVDQGNKTGLIVSSAVWRISGIAAVILLFLLGGTFLYRWQYTEHTIVTGNAERQQHTLPDGSTVLLNHASKLQYQSSFGDSTRTVMLTGEAFFDVVTDAKPFVVRTATAEVQVLGSRFNVWARQQETRLIVSEGSLKFRSLAASSPEEVILSQDQLSVCRENAPPTPPQPLDVDERLGWLQGHLVFEETSLAEFVAELERYYDVPIELAEPVSGSRTVSGTFRQQSLDSVLSTVCQRLDLHYRQVNGSYRIVP